MWSLPLRLHPPLRRSASSPSARSSSSFSPRSKRNHHRQTRLANGVPFETTAACHRADRRAPRKSSMKKYQATRATPSPPHPCQRRHQPFQDRLQRHRRRPRKPPTSAKSLSNFRPPRTANVSGQDLASRWRELTGPIPGAKSHFPGLAAGGGNAIDLEVTGNDIERTRGRIDHDQGELAKLRGSSTSPTATAAANASSNSRSPPAAKPSASASPTSPARPARRSTARKPSASSAAATKSKSWCATPRTNAKPSPPSKHADPHHRRHRSPLLEVAEPRNRPRLRRHQAHRPPPLHHRSPPMSTRPSAPTPTKCVARLTRGGLAQVTAISPRRHYVFQGEQKDQRVHPGHPLRVSSSPSSSFTSSRHPLQILRPARYRHVRHPLRLRRRRHRPLIMG